MATNLPLQSFDLKGVLDNCQDYVDQIQPQNTPFTNSLKSVPHRSNSFKWVQDSNDTIGVIGGEQETVDYSQITAGSPEDGTAGVQSERINYTQSFRKFVSISKTAAKTSVHGRTSETDYQLSKAITALKNQVEGTYLSGQTKKAATAADSKALTDGFSSQIPADCIIMGDITADNVDLLLMKLFDNFSTADTILCGKGVANSLHHIMSVGTKTGPRLQWQEAGKDFDTFTDSNGKLYKVISSNHLPEGQCFVYNSDDFSNVVFRDWKIEQLDSKGSYDLYMISGEFGLRHNGRHKAGLISPAAVPPAPPVTVKAKVKAAK